MKVTVKTTALISALGLAVVDSNVSSKFLRSTILQLKIADGKLTIYTEAPAIYTSVSINATYEDDSADECIFVESLMFKNLCSTISTGEVALKISKTNVEISFGKSKFNIPRISEYDVELSSPSSVSASDLHQSVPLISSQWKFVKERMMFAIAKPEPGSYSYPYPVYEFVRLGENGDVLVGDYLRSLFVHSVVESIGGLECLLTPDMVNLMARVPEGSRVVSMDKTIVLHYADDNIVFVSELNPKFESKTEIGIYNADIIMRTFSLDHGSVTIPVADLKCMISQATMLHGNEFALTIDVNRDAVIAYTDRVNISIPVTAETPSEESGEPVVGYSLRFNASMLRSVISKCSGASVDIAPTYNGNDLCGITLMCDAQEIVLAGVSTN